MKNFDQPENPINSNSPELLKEIDDFVKALPEQHASDPSKGTYSKLFWNHADVDMAKNFSLDEYIQDFEFLKSKFEGKSVVDLGSSIASFRTDLIKKLGIKTYTAIDKYHDLDDARKTEIKNELGEDQNFQFAKEDILRYISRLPDNSSHFIMNGIDKIIIPDETYWELLERELYRATENKGIITGFNALGRIEEYFSKGGRFTLVAHGEVGKGFFILEKN